jgi:protein involved in polysaccharide export with SLBB domain
LQTVAENRPTSPPAAGEAEAENAGYEIIPVNIARFLKGVVGNASLYIKPGDIVNVPPTDVFFVAGEVRKPGDFPLKDGTTLRQALSLAQGTNFEAALGRAVIFREDGGKRIEIPIDISAIMTNKKPDVSIMPNDVIMVPNSRAKSITGAFLRAFGSNAAHMPIP